jgi:hypothetical protein
MSLSEEQVPRLSTHSWRQLCNRLGGCLLQVKTRLLRQSDCDVDFDVYSHGQTLMKSPFIMRDRMWSETTCRPELRSLKHERKAMSYSQFMSKYHFFHNDHYRHYSASESYSVCRNPDTHFTFTMCNPPFYESHAAMKRSAATKAAPPQAVLTASTNELVVAGGEVGFVRRMIQESLILRGRCR